MGVRVSVMVVPGRIRPSCYSFRQCCTFLFNVFINIDKKYLSKKKTKKFIKIIKYTYSYVNMV